MSQTDHLAQLPDRSRWWKLEQRDEDSGRAQVEALAVERVVHGILDSQHASAEQVLETVLGPTVTGHSFEMIYARVIYPR